MASEVKLLGYFLILGDVIRQDGAAPPFCISNIKVEIEKEENYCRT